MVYSQSEICDAVDNLSKEDIKRLHYIALRFLDEKYTYNEAQDVVQEVIVRVLDGGWEFKKDKPFLKTLAGIVRSIASLFKDKGLRDEKLVYDTTHVRPMCTDSLSLVDYDHSTDQRMLTLLRSLNGEAECETLFRLKLNGQSKTQIVEHMKITHSQYETIYRRMTRNLSKIKSQGPSA